ncbi:MAG TPA: proton-conducting transporter membrane subunit [Xanthobacteraceae bacterium]|nr:proton-conducting transporter membrane subunit [Xanthobacteraceae bacterium]
MANDLLAMAFFAWIAAALLALAERGLVLARGLLCLGSLAGIAAALAALPDGTSLVALPTRIAGNAISFRIAPEGAWLLGFGLAPAALACALGTTAARGQAGWLFGAAASLIGALGVFGLGDGASFLIAWEIMSFGGALMILNEKLSSPGKPVLFMLALLEVGAVALMLAILLLAAESHSFAFAGFEGVTGSVGESAQVFIAVLLVIAFGAKLGLLPFYEWFPAAYSAGSGASGALMSGIVLNAAFFGLSRALLQWAPAQASGVAAGIGVFVVIVAVLSAVLTALYAFQQDDWRGLLSFSSAENAAIAVAMLGTALIFRGHAMPRLASLAWTVALLHLAGHALAKGGLFLTADGVYRASGSYGIVHSSVLRRSSWLFGLGALFAAMSLAAMPPQAGFVSEWYVFETVFQGFRLDTLTSRLVMALAGAGLALTVAIAFATYIKVFGIGLLGRSAQKFAAVRAGYSVVVGLLGFGVLALAVGMPLWLGALQDAGLAQFGTSAAREMHDGPILVPLTATFAFISPTLLAVVMPLLAIIPITLVLANWRFAVRRVPVWYGGFDQDPARASTTALTFSNALRTFYSFIYRPTVETTRESNGSRHYFVHRLVFSNDVAPIFGPYLFGPITRCVFTLANRFKALQSGQLNFYLALIGLLLVVILALALY